MDTYGDSTGLVPVTEVATMMGVSPLTIYRMAKLGQVHLYRGPRNRRVGLVEWSLVDAKQAVCAFTKTTYQRG